MMSTFLQKQEALQQLFAQVSSQEEQYNLLISLGREQPKLDITMLPLTALVSGCQSRTYVVVQYKNQLCTVQIVSDALISAGLGQLLTRVYSGEPLETFVLCEPTYLSTLKIFDSISPARAQGLMSMFAHMRASALLAAAKDESML